MHVTGEKVESPGARFAESGISELQLRNGRLTREEASKLLRRKAGYLALKRGFDLFNAAWQIVFFSPVLLLSAILIKLYDFGPVFFIQERITGGTKGPRTFKIVKFRTMVRNAEGMGYQITSKTDPRITPVGRVLRRLKIDEMPQLWNILRGDMSFVGPRPQTLGYVDKFKEHYEIIHSLVPAGLTDLASIRFRNEEEILSGAEDPEEMYIENVMPDKIEYHAEYVRKMGLLLDACILWKTIFQVFFLRDTAPFDTD